MNKHDLRSWHDAVFPGQVASVDLMQSRFNASQEALKNLNAQNVVQNATDKTMPKFQMPGFLTAGLADLKNNFGWNSATGAKVFGKDLGGWKGIGTWGTGLYHGAKAIGNANEIADYKTEANDLISDILRSSASNPLTNQFLTSDQTAMLNKLKRGTYDTDSNFTDFDLMSLLGGAGKGALSGGLIAGIPGAIIGGLGGGLNANLERQGQDQQNINAQLEGLYQALVDAEAQYNSMRRPNFTGLGIQSKYQNMYM